MITQVTVSGGRVFQVALGREEFLEVVAAAEMPVGSGRFVSVMVEAPTGGLTYALINVDHIVAIQGGLSEPGV